MADMGCANFIDYLKVLFPKYDNTRFDTKMNTVTSRDKKIADDLHDRFEAGPQTLWNAFKTVSEYSDTERTTRVKGRSEMSDEVAEEKTKENRLRSNLSGSSAKMKKKAWRILSAPTFAT
jgi:hypothetical protein